MSDTEDDSFPLAAVLFDCQLTRQYSTPQQHAPETWRAAFAAQAGARTLLSLLGVSRGARDVVLQSAPRLTLLLDLTDRVDIQVWVRQLESVAQRLRTRGTLPVALRVQCHHSLLSGALLILLPPALQGAGAGVTELTIVCAWKDQGPNKFKCVEATARDAGLFMQRVAASLPNLRRLNLQHMLCTLPPPQSLPQLMQLSITGEYRLQGEPAIAAHCSVALLLPQLSSFTYEGGAWPNPASGQEGRNVLVFTPASTTHTLTRLVTSDSLTDALLGLLLKLAPALRELSVGELAMTTSHRGSTWGMQRLENTRILFLTACTLLPTNPKAVVDIVGPDLYVRAQSYGNQVPYYANFAHRAHEWRFPDIVTLGIMGQPSADDGQAATTLRQLRGLQAPMCRILILWSGACTLDAARALAAELPAWSHMCVSLCQATQLTDELLSVIMHMGPHLEILWVRALQLTQQALGAWPCQELDIEGSVDLRMLAKLPDPTSCSTVPLIRCSNITVSELTQAEANGLTAWLSHVAFHHSPATPAGGNKPEITFHLYCTDANPDQLSAQLSVLRAVRLQPADTGTHVLVKLEGCAMTSDTMAVLSTLPAWRGRIEFSGCQWPAGEQAAAICTQLAKHVPASYTRWVLPSVRRQALKHICAGINQRREGLGLPRLTVCAQLPTEPDVRAALAGKHVVLEDLRT